MTRRLQIEEPADLSNRLNVHVLIDASGSMTKLAEDTIGSFNEYRQRLAEDSPDSLISLSLFSNNSVRPIFIDTRSADAPELTRAQYSPSGGTPLYDAIGTAVGSLDAIPVGRKALVIITDGQESGSSRTHTKATIKTLLDERQEMQSWLVLYLGANQDAFAEGHQLGTMSGHTMNFAATGSGVRRATSSAYGSTMRYASANSLSEAITASAFTPEERDDAV